MPPTSRPTGTTDGEPSIDAHHHQATAALTRLGGYFAIESSPSGSTWLDQSELATHSFVAERLALRRRRISDQAGRGVPTRITSSVGTIGLLSRLISPIIGASVLGIDAPTRLLWRDQPEVEVFDLAGASWGPPDLDALLSEVIVPLCERIRADHRVNTHVLAGNTASAIFGALGFLGVPDHPVGALALRHPFLAGEADVIPRFRRRSCCLRWQWGAALCGDCALDRAPSLDRS